MCRTSSSRWPAAHRSLIDRQLALLDELEAEVDDPAVLANYYQLDHLATRMRRNSESLLVLANAESRRRRTKATEIDDVVRAAIGEVEDYRRIDVLNLDHLQVRGAVVADISHLLAELLDNASSFSPPESRVTSSGRYAGEHYLISIADEGVGIGTDRLDELNDLLEHPPIVGLSVEPTLGMSVVSLLAHKHGVQVRLVPSSPGLLVEVVLPATLYGPIDATGLLGTEPASNGHATVGARHARGLGQRCRAAHRHVRSGRRVPSSRRPHHPSRSSTPVGRPFDVEPAIASRDTMFARRDGVRRSHADGARRLADRRTPTPPVAEPTFEPEWSIEPEWSRRHDRTVERTVEPDPVVDAEPDDEPARRAGRTRLMPPQSHDRLSGEFDRPPAPPSFGFEPTSRPFTDPTARPIPARRTESEQHRLDRASATPFLPTRSRGHRARRPGPPRRPAHRSHRSAQPVASHRRTRAR